MELIDLLIGIGDAVRYKTKKTGKLSLEQMATDIRGITPVLQNKTVTPSETKTNTVADANYDGLGTVTVNAISSTYVGSGVMKQGAKSITPTKSSQTAVSANTYVTGNVSVNAIPSEYIIPSGSETKTANGTYDVTSLAQLIVNVSSGGGGLPSSISKFNAGTFTLDSDIQSGSSTTSSTNIRTITHGLGVVPDIILIYHMGAIDVTYSELGMLWSNNNSLAWRANYPTQCLYHSNSTSTVSGGSCQTAYGIRDVTSTQFKLKCHSSTNYYWRAGTYNFMALKFA